MQPTLDPTNPVGYAITGIYSGIVLVTMWSIAFPLHAFAVGYVIAHYADKLKPHWDKIAFAFLLLLVYSFSNLLSQ